MAFPSTFQDLQNAVIAKQRLHATNDLAKTKDWINQAYARAAADAEFVRATTTTSLSAAASSTAAPTGTIRIISIQSKPASGDYGSPLQRVPLSLLLHYRGQSTANGTPSHFSVTQSTVEFWPPATASAVLQFYISKLPTALSANGDLPVIDEPWATYILQYGALAEAADFLRDPNEPEYRQLYEFWLADYKRHLDLRAGQRIEPRGAQPQFDPELVPPAPAGRRS